MLRTPVYESINRATEADQVTALANAIAILGPTPEEARAALAHMLNRIARSDNPRHVTTLARALEAFDLQFRMIASDHAAEALKTRLATTDEPHTAAALASALSVFLPANSAERYVAAIVELLKWPTTVGPATDALLEALHERVPEAPGKEAGLDATVAWVAATYPDIDLDSPPTYPASGSTGGGW